MKRFAYFLTFLSCIGVFFIVAVAPTTRVKAQEQKPLSCSFRMFQADANYSLPYKNDKAEILNASTVEAGSYLIYTFEIKTNDKSQKTLTNVALRQVSGASEPIEIVGVRPQNGTCRIENDKTVNCSISYTFFDGTSTPIEYLVKITGDQNKTTTSSLFDITTSFGKTQCANWLRIKPAPPAVNPITWDTPYARLTASNFYIRVGEQKFYGKQPIILHSSPGVTQTTLEASWQENGVEMRLYLYFRKRDASMWELYEIRTYNGKQPGDWIYYKDSLGNPVGSMIGYHDYAYERTFVPTDQTDAKIYCKSCEFEALMPQPIPVSAYGYSLEAMIGLPKGEIIALSTYPAGGYGVNVVLRDKSGAVVKNQSEFTYQWLSENPLVAQIKASTLDYGNGTCEYEMTPPCPMNHIDITGGKSGQTTIDVQVIQTSNGATVASTSFPVKVFDKQEIETSPSPVPSGATLSPEQKELIRVKQDVQRISRELETQKKTVNSLQYIVEVIRQFINSLFGKRL